MSEDPRITRFKQIVEADPDDELGHFSLGTAYLKADRLEEAAASLARVLELNPRMSKAYQLLAEAYEKGGRRDNAVDVLTRGVTVADEQGDRMPRNAMANMLCRLDAPVPAFKETEAPHSAADVIGASTPGFQCSRCARPQGRLPKPPFKGPLGEKVYANVCNLCWGEWISTGTMVINELGLNLSEQEGQDLYDQHMVEFLELEGR
jgi:Fe-S cluster biosynthesis and repair protein YggX/predicted TPR repeat methyltransferase